MLNTLSFMYKFWRSFNSQKDIHCFRNLLTEKWFFFQSQECVVTTDKCISIGVFTQDEGRVEDWLLLQWQEQYNYLFPHVYISLHKF